MRCEGLYALLWQLTMFCSAIITHNNPTEHGDKAQAVHELKQAL
jgi:hypothetical protein